jgi:hypothetical protein
MNEMGYEVAFSATARVMFADPGMALEDGFFYIKSFMAEEDGAMVISSFAQTNEMEETNSLMIVTDFWEDGVQVAWYKEDEDDETEPWIIEVTGSLIVQPLNHPDAEEWRLEEGDIFALQLEFRQDGDSPPEHFESYEFVDGTIFSVRKLIKNAEDEWEDSMDEDE